jgi:hypothetical protein
VLEKRDGSKSIHLFRAVGPTKWGSGSLVYLVP